ncbi:hypothetical protein JCM16303_001022 [Sporobolomyces ruberrimus]
MKHVLSPGKTPEPSWTSALVTPPSFLQGGDSEKDPELQPTSAGKNRKKNEKNLSWKRKLYIAGTCILCCVLIVIGIVLGLKAVREREEAAEKGFSPALVADHAQLVAQGENMQAQLGGGAIVDHSKEEVHQIEEYGEEEEHDDDDGELEEEDLDVDIEEESADSTAFVDIAIPVSSPAAPPSAIPSTPTHSTMTKVVTATEPGLVHDHFPELQELFDGNQRFINDTNLDSPGLLRLLGTGQKPHFATLGCSDSRVSETLILGAKVGDIFATRNIGNQYLIDSLSTESVFSYAISHLGVSHLIVLGHTKCGAVLASIVSESKATMDDIGENRIMTWIRPIRSLYSTSTRQKIVSFRESMSAKKQVTAQDVTSDVWNALIEENVKAQVRQLATDPSVLKSWRLWGEGQAAGSKGKRSAAVEDAELIELWVHGFVYDVDTGLVHDLGVSVGPRLK